MLRETPRNQSVKHKKFKLDISTAGDDEWVMQSILDACHAFNEEIEYLSGNPCLQLKYCLDALPLIEMLNRLGKLDLEIPNSPQEITIQVDNTISFVNQIEKHVTAFLRQHGSKEVQKRINRESDILKVNLSIPSRDRAQYLISELRSIVTSSQTINDDHRHRLLIRIEKLQLELHKSTSDIDRYLGLVSEAGQVLGQFGKDAKPFVEMLKELRDIFRVKSSLPKEIEGEQDSHQLSNEDDEEA